MSDGCLSDCADLSCVVTVGRSKKEFMEPHGRKVSAALPLNPIDKHKLVWDEEGAAKIFLDEKGYAALIGTIGTSRSRASFYLHAEVTVTCNY